MDGNNGRALVKMAVGGNEVEVNELLLKPVTAKEYKDSARVLSKWSTLSVALVNIIIDDIILQIRISTTDTSRNKKESAKKKKKGDKKRTRIRRKRGKAGAGAEAKSEIGIGVGAENANAAGAKSANRRLKKKSRSPKSIRKITKTIEILGFTLIYAFAALIHASRTGSTINRK